MKAFLRVRNNFEKVYEADIADLMSSVYLNQYILSSLVTENELNELSIQAYREFTSIRIANSIPC